MAPARWAIATATSCESIWSLASTERIWLRTVCSDRFVRSAITFPSDERRITRGDSNVLRLVPFCPTMTSSLFS